MSVIIRRAVIPPGRTALAESNLGIIDQMSGLCHRIGVVLGVANSPSCEHQILDQSIPCGFVKRGIALAPQPLGDGEYRPSGVSGYRADILLAPTFDRLVDHPLCFQIGGQRKHVAVGNINQCAGDFGLSPTGHHRSLGQLPECVGNRFLTVQKAVGMFGKRFRTRNVFHL